MERDEISKILCRSGCGFYGSSAQDGLCSVCFKDALKKKCVPTTASSAGSTSGGSATVVSGASDQQPIIPINTGDQSSSASAIIDVSQSLPGPSTSTQSSEDEKKASKTKNRCDMCRKKVGLTGFDCRCGNIYCAVHRYSDKHDCSYNYREQGAAEIRRNNPQIMGQKINKI